MLSTLLSMGLRSRSRRASAPYAVGKRQRTRAWHRRRRIGAPDAKNRSVLLDAAERLMLEEGYAAVDSRRRVADRSALKPQLVHYYFRTMEDLYLAVFRRRADQGLEAQAQALQSPQPLWALWRYSSDPRITAFTVEFMALGQPPAGAENRIRALRRDVSGEGTSDVGRGAAALWRRRVRGAAPIVWAVFATSLSRVLCAWRQPSACRRGTPKRWNSSSPGCGSWRANRPHRRWLRQPGAPESVKSCV